MWFSRIVLKNIKSFKEQQDVDFSRNINLLVGKNNSGKSTILNTMLILQHQELANLTSETYPIDDGIVHLYFEELGKLKLMEANSPHPLKRITIKIEKNTGALTKYALEPPSNGMTLGESYKFIDFPRRDPNNILYPILTRRRSVNYREDYSAETTNDVSGDLANLHPKISRLSKYGERGHDLYIKSCTEIFGYPILTADVEKGVRAGYKIDDKLIPLKAMGDGVTQLLGFIVDLCRAENKIFLIEEPENDIHPQALKGLLRLIEEKSVNNQFFISTHSNIVVKDLGALPTTKVFKVEMVINDTSKEPESNIKEIGDSENERIGILEDLGYEFFDFGLWKAWLLLEESSAEKIIREFLIPLFVPGLQQKLRTISANSLSQIEPKFIDFHRLFTFLHLEPVYKNKAWVFIDGGDKEKVILDDLKGKFKTWNEDHFQQFTEHDFEKYYPKHFENEVAEVLAIANKDEKRKQKKLLLDKVGEWLSGNKEEGKATLAVSAIEIIDKLKQIELALGEA